MIWNQKVIWLFSLGIDVIIKLYGNCVYFLSVFPCFFLSCVHVAISFSIKSFVTKGASLQSKLGNVCKYSISVLAFK